MFHKNYEQRLNSWSSLRQKLEVAADPFQEVIDFYKQAPYVSVHTDPWSQDMWPDPWELVYENQYDEFCTVLGMCYSLQLTDRFKGSEFEIHICTLESLSYVYLLFVDDYVLGYDNNTVVLKKDLPMDLQSQTVYAMPKLN
jgi:hypothetical protein